MIVTGTQPGLDPTQPTITKNTYTAEEEDTHKWLLVKKSKTIKKHPICVAYVSIKFGMKINKNNSTYTHLSWINNVGFHILNI